MNKYVLAALLFVGLLTLFSCKAFWPAQITIEPAHAQEILLYVNQLDNNLRINSFSGDENSYQISISTFGLEDPTLGMAMPGVHSCDVILSESLFAEHHNLLKSVIWHELGHCAGLEHLDDPNAIMYFEANEFERYSKREVQKFLQDFRKALAQ